MEERMAQTAEGAEIIQRRHEKIDKHLATELEGRVGPDGVRPGSAAAADEAQESGMQVEAQEAATGSGQTGSGGISSSK